MYPWAGSWGGTLKHRCLINYWALGFVTLGFVTLGFITLGFITLGTFKVTLQRDFHKIMPTVAGMTGKSPA
jgi:hypothetical protein